MPTRTAVALAATVIMLKAVLIGLVARGRCELIGRCGDGTAWYVGFSLAGAVCGVLVVLMMAGAIGWGAHR